MTLQQHFSTIDMPAPVRLFKQLARTLMLGSVLLAATSGSSLAQDSALYPFEVVYDVGNNVISAGSATLSLARDGDEWIYSLNTTPTGVFKLTGKGKIQETSIFRADESMSLQPQRYSYRQDSESKRSVDAWFNWDDNELTYKSRGEEVTESFSDPILDRLSVTLTVMNELRDSGFKVAELNVFDKGRVKTVTFLNEGNEQVKTRMGNMQTIKVRSGSASGSRHTYTWFAPELDYVPVRIEQFKRNKLVARLTITSLRNRITESGGGASVLLPKQK